MTDLLLRPHQPAALPEAIQGLYAAFAGYGYRTMPACAHCVSDDDLLALGAVPLHELPGPLLGRYTIKAVSTWGEVSDFKWLLPRLAELLAARELPVPADTLTTKLRRAAWAAWPAHERAAVGQFLLAWWLEALAAVPSPGVPATGRLAAVAIADADLTPYLTGWHATLQTRGADRQHALGHLVAVVGDARFDPDVPATVRAFFREPAGPAAAQTAAWLAGPELAEEVDRAIYDLAHTPLVRRLTVTSARLRRYRTAAR